MIEVTDAGSAQLATAAQLKSIHAHLSDEHADGLIDQASAIIASACSRVLHEQTVSQTWRNPFCPYLLMDRYPVTNIASVVVDGEALSADEFELDGSFLYRLGDDARARWTGAKIVVSYVGGYGPEEIPHDLNRACLDLCVNLEATQGRDMTLRGVSVPDVENITYRDPSNGGSIIPDHVMAVIDYYREIRI